MVYKRWVVSQNKYQLHKMDAVPSCQLMIYCFLPLTTVSLSAYCVEGSPNIAHKVNEHSAFCHFTWWPISYWSLIYLPRQSVYACGMTWHAVNWKVVCGNTVNNCMCWSCAMAHSPWHTASTYRSTRSVGGCTVPSYPPCTGIPFMPHLPYCERGHSKASLM